MEVVVPAFNESAEAISATIRALSNQTHPVHRVIIVDDASRDPIRLSEGMSSHVEVLRLGENRGISAARNRGIAHSHAPWIACVNMEVLPEPDWLETCICYLRDHPTVGAVGARTVPLTRPGALDALVQWRSVVQERPFPEASGPIDWLPGHAILFRRAALEEVDGFDVKYARAGEDVDICHRLWQRGWQVHYTSETVARSIQDDSLATLARAEYNRFCWRADGGNGFIRGLAILTGRGLLRTGIHLVRGNWRLVPVEVGVWLEGSRLAWQKR